MQLRKHLEDEAESLSRIRAYLTSHGAIEVNTKTLLPEVLAHPTTRVFSVTPEAEDAPKRLFLQASPELEMRRLVAEGAGQIFQICHAYRDEIVDLTHDREFLLLEWYIPGASYIELREKVCQFVHDLCSAPLLKVTCEEVFQKRFAVDLLAMTAWDLDQLYRRQFSVSDTEAPNLSVVKFGQLLEVSLAELLPNRMVCVSDYPPFDTCFGKRRQDGFIERFEIFLDGVEIANGYQEIESSSAFLDRFREENDQRREYGFGLLPDPRVLDMPICAGVAIGIGRLLSFVQQAKQCRSEELQRERNCNRSET